MKAMVERTQVELEARDGRDWTPLLWTAYHGHLPVVQYLCEYGADKETRTRGGMIPLHCARKLAVTQYLRGQGGD